MSKDRITALQKAVKDAGLSAYYLNTSDYHMSEYVPEYFKTIRYFSGFTGSLATLIVEPDNAYIFVDGRYHIQAENETKGSDVEVIKLGTAGAKEPLEFIKERYLNKTIGFDGRRTSVTFGRSVTDAGIKVSDIDIYSGLISERAPLGDGMIRELAIEYTGMSRKDKLDRILYILNGRCHVINNLESIAYLLNMRSDDIVYTPVFLAYMLFYQNEVYLFADIRRFDPHQLDGLYADGVIIRPYDSYYDFLRNIRNETIVMDENKVNYSSYYALLRKGNRFVNIISPVEEMKAIKNSVEQENARLAHIYDGVAMVRFLKWLKESDKEGLNELDAVNKLNEFRLSYKAFDLSFNPIVAYNANAAMMHYSPKEGQCADLHNEGILLVDSGGQYLEGTTDITRTIALGPVSDKLKMHFTTVLKSMLNLSNVRFMAGMTGAQLDVLARKDIWALGIDYRCGTGHGVGQVLSVHETPPNVRYMHTASRSEEYALREGNLFSDEPGIYLEGEYGLRCENMLICHKDISNEYGQFMSFETVTMVPFDLELIDRAYLDRQTIAVLNAYHQEVFDKLSPHLNDEEKRFLASITRAL